jgi:hypothetical protein
VSPQIRRCSFRRYLPKTVSCRWMQTWERAALDIHSNLADVLGETILVEPKMELKSPTTHTQPPSQSDNGGAPLSEVGVGELPDPTLVWF